MAKFFVQIAPDGQCRIRRDVETALPLYARLFPWLRHRVEKVYAEIADLPPAVRDNLPTHAQQIFLGAFNAAYKEYDKDEPKAFRVAWAAVKLKYKKSPKGTWVEKAALPRRGFVYLDAACALVPLGVNTRYVVSILEDATGYLCASILTLEPQEGAREIILMGEFGPDPKTFYLDEALEVVTTLAKAKYVLQISGLDGEYPYARVSAVKEAEIKDGVLLKSAPTGPPIRVLKAEEGDRQIVTMVVMEPDEKDTYGDWLRPVEIEKAQERFMCRYPEHSQIGLGHLFDVGGAKIVESYIAPADLEINAQPVTKGSWVMSVYHPDPSLWALIRSGELTGASFGGWVQRVPDPAAEGA